MAVNAARAAAHALAIATANEDRAEVATASTEFVRALQQLVQEACDASQTFDVDTVGRCSMPRRTLDAIVNDAVLCMRSSSRTPISGMVRRENDNGWSLVVPHALIADFGFDVFRSALQTRTRTLDVGLPTPFDELRWEFPITRHV